METFLSFSLRKRKDVEKSKITRFAKAAERSARKLLSDLEERKEVIEAELEDFIDVVVSNGHGVTVVREVTSADNFINHIFLKKIELRDLDIKIAIMEKQVEFFTTSKSE